MYGTIFFPVIYLNSPRIFCLINENSFSQLKINIAIVNYYFVFYQQFNNILIISWLCHKTDKKKKRKSCKYFLHK